MSELKQKLQTTSQREDSGAQTNSRYHYQALCGLVLVLERHQLDGDYALVFEYHDDIALFDDKTLPKSVQFYQVKSKKSGTWTPAALTKRASKNGVKSHSFLGKMYENVVAFGDSVESSTFVSNAPANFAPSGKQKFCLSECSSKDLKAITQKLEAEFTGADTIKSELLWVSQTDLSLADADTHAKGKLDAFVVANLGEVEFSLAALFKAVSDECDRKSRAADVDFTNFDDVVLRRGITRADADGWLQIVSSTVECPKWEEVATEVNLPVMEKVRLGREWNSYRVEVLNPNDAVLKVRRAISNFIEENDLESLSLNELLAAVFDAVVEEARDELPTASNERIKAMIIYETYSIK